MSPGSSFRHFADRVGADRTAFPPSFPPSGTVEFANFPSIDGVVPTPQVLQIPNMYARDGTGSVCTMEWSSDGYVLAVGWEKGWAIWSVGGRCLAWGFGVEYEVDEERFQDAFMYGVQSLVSSTTLLTYDPC